ncbi:MAG: cell division protein ZipA C-terminal FtsZ-binding domain-containing protein [Woeseiaceae bacterium]
MDSLRIALLVIGVVIVVVIYWNAKRKTSAELHHSKPQARVEPDFDEMDAAPESSIIRVTPDFSQSVDELTTGEDTKSLPKLGEDTENATHVDIGVADEPAEQAPPKAKVPEKVLSLRIIKKDGGEFPASDVIRLLAGSGLAHGQFDIFHKLSDGEGSDALFSVASLTEPGTFDLENLRDKTLAGLSFFMLRPGPGRGVDAFDKMIEIARAVAISLQGELLDGDGSSMSNQRERFLREDLIQYELKHLQLQ